MSIYARISLFPYLSAASCAALLAAQSLLGQTAPPAPAPDAAAPAAPGASGGTSSSATIELSPVQVTSQLDQARSQILPDLGATAYSISAGQLQTMSQGEDAPFNQVLLRAPGVAQDSAVNGDLHVRGEHANLQYRIDGVLLPEGITGFGLELDPRFVSSMQLITGSLPAEYGFRTAGVVDVETKTGQTESGGDVDFYGGSYSTFRQSFEDGGSQGGWSYFVDGSYDHNDIGIENPTPSAVPLHDSTEQFKGFAYLSRILDASSRVSIMAGVSSSDYQVPDTAGLPAGTSPDGSPWLPGSFDSAGLNERQNERNAYVIAAYQKTAGDLNYQIAAYGRYSGVHFLPDPVGDLYFNGVATDVDRVIGSGGFQADASYPLGETHTLRFGATMLDEGLTSDTTTTVFPVDADGDPTGPAYPIVDDGPQHALFLGSYLQDEWKIARGLTFNYGARFDEYSSSFDREGQASPRANLIWQATDSVTLHAGYARYFTPPPLENVPSSTVTQFNGTSNASAVTLDDPVRAERSDYFDAGASWKLAPGFQVGVDGYYKMAHNQLDDGLFGQSLILSAFNYLKGLVRGVELTTSYAQGGFSAYANLALSKAQGLDWDSAQFLFGPSDLTYVASHWIYLDHDQGLTGSGGISYDWKEGGGHDTLFYADVISGSGLRQDGGGVEPNDPTSPIPNGASVPSYWSLNLGIQQTFPLEGETALKLRLDVVNLTDQVYELRAGTGVGVNAAQYGMRRGFFGTVSWLF